MGTSAEEEEGRTVFIRPSSMACATRWPVHSEVQGQAYTGVPNTSTSHHGSGCNHSVGTSTCNHVPGDTSGPSSTEWAAFTYMYTLLTIPLAHMTIHPSIHRHHTLEKKETATVHPHARRNCAGTASFRPLGLFFLTPVVSALCTTLSPLHPLPVDLSHCKSVFIPFLGALFCWLLLSCDPAACTVVPSLLCSLLHILQEPLAKLL